VRIRPARSGWLGAAVRFSARAVRPSPGLIVFCAAFAYLCLFAGVLQRIGDEGTLVNGAARVAEGAVPYRDFADLANPLSFYWLGGWFAAFGTSLAVARLLLVLTGACTAALVYWLAARAYGLRTGLTAAVLTTVLGIPFWPATNHHWDSNLFFLATLACLALWQSRPGSRYALLAGIGAAATAGFMINKGALALLVALVMVWRGQAAGRSRTLVAVLVGFSGPIVAIGAVFVATGAVSDLLYINLIFPFTRYEDTGWVPYAFYFRDLAWVRPLAVLTQVVPPVAARLLAAVLAVPLGTLAAVPLLAVLSAGARTLPGREGWGEERALLWVGGIALWLSEAHRWDVFHLMYGSPLILAGIIGEALVSGHERGWRSRLVGGLTACTVALGIWQSAVGLAAQVPQETRRGTVRTYARDDALQFLLDKTKPGDFVFVYPYYPMYYFLADVRNPTRYGILLYGYNTIAQFQEALEDLDRKRPEYVLWDRLVDGDNWKRWYPAYVQPPERDLIIEPYLNRYYKTIATKSGFRIMQRTDYQPSGK
jgi:4-amino-4-deoxy-L-arabinose transferase-like glycosyltransferase